MTWLIIIGVMALVLGPILYVLPTPRQRQQERLRRKARELDLHVQARNMPHPDPEPDDRVSSGGKLRRARLDAMAYVLPVRTPRTLETRFLPDWRVVKQRQASGVAGLPEGWAFDKAGLPLRPDVLQPLTALLEAAPRGTLGLEGNGGGVALLWSELGGDEEVAAVAAFLQQLADYQLQQGERAQRAAQRAEDDD